MKETYDQLMRALEARFEANMGRHRDCEWAPVRARLEADPDKLRSLLEMERTGGEPDVVGLDAATGAYEIFDCSAESPNGRRSLCYDEAALDARKEAKPSGSVERMAQDMGVQILSEEEYRRLQTLGEFDLKTSSWLRTPAAIRALGGAVFGDRRYDTVFVYHNGAQSYYASRGFRGVLRV